MNILVVEDDEDSAALLSMLLEREGWRVEAVSSVSEARRALDAQPYSVLVTDLHLGDGSGMSLLAEPTRYPPKAAIVVSGLDDEAQRKACFRVGFARCLIKPLGGPEIVATIRALTAGLREAHE